MRRRLLDLFSCAGGAAMGYADDWPDLVAAVRHRLQQVGVPYIIENVEGASADSWLTTWPLFIQ